MKKLLLLSALTLGALSLNAQNFTVTVEGKPVKNGETVISHHLSCVETEYNGETYRDYNLNPEVYVTAEADMPATVTLTNTSAIAEPATQICWPTNCVVVHQGLSVSPEGTFLAGVPTDLLVESSPLYGDDPEHVKILQSEFTLSCTVNIVPNNNPANAFTFYLNIVNDPQIYAGVDAVVDDNAPVEYFDLAGRKVVNPEKGQIVIERKGAKAVKRIF